MTVPSLQDLCFEVVVTSCLQINFAHHEANDCSFKQSPKQRQKRAWKSRNLHMLGEHTVATHRYIFEDVLAEITSRQVITPAHLTVLCHEYLGVLDLSCARWIDTGALKGCFSVPWFHLRTFKAPQLLDQGAFTLILRQCPALACIDISECLPATDQWLEMLASKTLLEEVRASGCPGITGTGIHSLGKQLLNLATLDLSRNAGLRPSECMRDVVEVESLTHLHLNECPPVDVDDVRNLVRLKRLTSLSVVLLVSSLPPASMDVLAKGLPELTSLSLSLEGEGFDLGAFLNAFACSPLTTLAIQAPGDAMVWQRTSTLSTPPHLVLPRLHTLDFGGISGFSTAALAGLAGCAPNLERLHVRVAPAVRAPALTKRVLEVWPRLVDLRVDGAAPQDEEGELRPFSSQLRSLELSHCCETVLTLAEDPLIESCSVDNVTIDEGSKVLIGSPSLQHLDMRKCAFGELVVASPILTTFTISESTVTQLSIPLPLNHLTTVDASYCFLSAAATNTLLGNCSVLEVLKLNAVMDTVDMARWHLPWLRVLGLHACRVVLSNEDSRTINTGDVLKFIPSCPRLRDLSLVIADVDAKLRNLIKRIPRLASLSLSRCSATSGTIVLDFSSSSFVNFRVERLFSSNVLNIRSDSLTRVAVDNCIYLKTLSLRTPSLVVLECTRDNGLSEIEQVDLGSLAVCTLWKCALDKEIYRTLIGQSPNLAHLFLSEPPKKNRKEKYKQPSKAKSLKAGKRPPQKKAESFVSYATRISQGYAVQIHVVTTLDR